MYSQSIKFAVSIVSTATSKRRISLCGCVHALILSSQFLIISIIRKPITFDFPIKKKMLSPVNKIKP